VQLPPHLDFPDVTIGGFTPTDGQWTAATAVAVGVVGTLLLIAIWRRARKAFLVGLVTVAAAAAWIRFTR
jgi:hypothetical protein